MHQYFTEGGVNRERGNLREDRGFTNNVDSVHIFTLDVCCVCIDTQHRADDTS